LKPPSGLWRSLATEPEGVVRAVAMLVFSPHTWTVAFGDLALVKH